MKQFIRLAGFFAVLLLLAACSNESQRPLATGKGRVSAINAIATSPPIGVLIEQRAIGSVSYAAALSATRFDDLDYRFNFDVQLSPGASLTRVAHTDLSVVKDTDYVFVISGSLQSPDIRIWESPIPELSEGATTFDVQFGHSSPATGSYDIYFLDPATAPAVGTESGTVSFGDLLPYQSFPQGDYVLTITAPGDPASVLYESEPLAVAGGAALLITTFDTTPNATTQIIARAFDRASSSTAGIIPVGVTSKIRYYHAAYDAGNVDVYFESPLAQPDILDHAFGDVTAEIEVPDNSFPLTYTTAGNMGNILLDTTYAGPPASRTNLYLIDLPGTGQALVNFAPDRRPVETAAAVSILNTAPVVPGVDVYALTDGETLDDKSPILSFLILGTAPQLRTFDTGVYDIYVTVAGEKTVLAGPTQLDLQRGDVVETIIYETADPAVVDFVVIPGP